jgi:hypothetical protein
LRNGSNLLIEVFLDEHDTTHLFHSLLLAFSCGRARRFEAGGASTGLFRLSALDPGVYGPGLRTDLEQLEKDPVTALVESLKRHGVSEEVLQEALAEVVQR